MADCASFMTINMVLSLMLFGASLLLPFLQVIFVEGGWKVDNLSQLFLKYALFFNVGCLFIMGSAGQFLYAPEISACIGWGWSPFQYELAFSELCLGILGLVSPIFNKEFWLATVIATVIWLIGGSAVHLYYLFAHHNDALLNASFVICWNIILSVWLIGLYAVQASIGASFYKLFSPALIPEADIE
jgi:hypothetical protein